MELISGFTVDGKDTKYAGDGISILRNNDGWTLRFCVVYAAQDRRIFRSRDEHREQVRLQKRRMTSSITRKTNAYFAEGQEKKAISVSIPISSQFQPGIPSASIVSFLNEKAYIYVNRDTLLDPVEPRHAQQWADMIVLAKGLAELTGLTIPEVMGAGSEASVASHVLGSLASMAMAMFVQENKIPAMFMSRGKGHDPNNAQFLFSSEPSKSEASWYGSRINWVSPMREYAGLINHLIVAYFLNQGRRIYSLQELEIVAGMLNTIIKGVPKV